MKEEFRDVTEGPELTTMGMSTELEIDSCFRDFLDLLRCMVEENRWSLWVISRDRTYNRREITMLTGKRMVDPDEVESLERHDLIVKDPSLRLLENGECPLDPEIGLMIPIDIEDTFWSGDIIEAIDEMLESSIHPIEEISRNTEDFWVQSIHSIDDTPQEVSPQDMSYVYVRDLNYLFSYPSIWKVPDRYRNGRNMDIYSVIEAIHRDNRTKNQSQYPEEGKRKEYLEIHEDKSQQPYRSESQ
jgi:hypothetical protein